MLKLLYGMAALLVIPVGLYAQQPDIHQVLNTIEANNLELVAFKKYIATRSAELQSTTNLPNPEVEFDYLPGKPESAGTQKDLQIMQSFEFPTVYANRKQYNEKNIEQLELEYLSLRQSVLLAAQQLCLQLVNLQKKEELLATRHIQAQTVLEKSEQLYRAEQVGILDYNKARIAWLGLQFDLEQNQLAQDKVLKALTAYNGGMEVSLDTLIYDASLELPTADTLWQEKTEQSPEFKTLDARIALAEEFIDLKKSLAFPRLMGGYHYQAVLGQTYSGFRAGITLPLWESRNTVKSARFNYEYQLQKKESVLVSEYQTFLQDYNQYQLLLEKYQEYQNTLGTLNSEALLTQAFELGEISFMEYYQEVRFFRDAYDKMLDIEQELLLLKAELLKHQL